MPEDLHSKGYWAALNSTEQSTDGQVERNLRQAKEDLVELQSRVSFTEGQIDGYQRALTERQVPR